MTTLYHNGKILTMDPAARIVDAILVDGDRIIALGEDAHRLGRGAGIDLEGRAVVPGMIDAHTHLEASALSVHEWLDIRGLSLDESLERMRQRVAQAKPGEWVIAQGTFGQEGAKLDRHMLDRIAPNNPVMFRPSVHRITGNTFALRLAGLMDRKADPIGVWVERDSDGLPLGEVQQGPHLFPIDMPTVEDLAGIIAHEIRERFNRFGVTGIYEVPMSTTGIRAYQHLERTGALTARIGLNPIVGPGMNSVVGDIDHWAAFGLQTGFGSDRLWLGAVKLYLDGGYEAMFSLSNLLTDSKDRKHPKTWGHPVRLFNDMVRNFVTAYQSGLQVWVHALGDDGQRFTIDAIAEAQKIAGGDFGLRTRVEHLFNFFPETMELMDELKALHITPVPTAAFMHFDTGLGVFPFRTLIEEGFMPPGNSDNGGTQPFACNPWFGIGKMVTRRTKDGRLVRPEERIGVLDAIRCYTEFAAYAGHRDGKMGIIAPGALADFAILSDDPLTVPDEQLEHIDSELTVLAGAPVWEK